jgi:asparagine synthase (glutamine-hydrolysing)
MVEKPRNSRMCAICGGVSVDVEAMLAALKHRGPEAKGVFRDGRIALGHNLLSIIGHGKQPFSGCRGDFILVCNGEIYNHEELCRRLASHEFNTTSDNEVVLHLIEENYQGSLTAAVKDSVPELDGDYAFAVYHKGEVVLARDPVGVKPLYYCGDAFASERKALWRLGREAKALSPGAVMRLGGEEEKVNLPGKKVKTPLEELERALTSAVEKRTRNVKAGLLFSAGLDSSLLAGIAKELGREPALYTAGLEGCLDFKYAERAEECFEVRYKVIGEDELPRYARKVIYAIEEFNAMKVCVGIPLYAACEAAREDGLKVVLSGQGADELFAGYYRYLSMSMEELEKALLEDFTRIAEVNLQRDDAVAMANSVELRLPYLDREVVRVALGLPLEYKIKDGRRKHILRLLARRKGLPEFMVERDKKAVQYASGVEKALRRLAKEAGKTLEGYLKGIYEEIQWT